MKKIKLLEPIDVQPDKRMHDHVMDVAMGDVIDALVELITNADDSYGRLYRSHKRPGDHGRILIERCEQRKGQSSYVLVRDRAEGMTLERMIEVLKAPGAMTSTVGDRGYMGRGAKDCARFGKMTFESIRDDRYYRCVLTKRAAQVIPEERSQADRALREKLRIPHGNGTIVRLEVGEEFKIPQLKTLGEELSRHYGLQGILDEESGGEVLLRNGLKPEEKPEKVVSRRPDAETVCENDRFSVPGYPGVVARISIYRTAEPFDDRPPRTRPYGFLIVDTRAIHERSLLDSMIERDPNSRRYFGRIECNHIAVLLGEYEERRRRGDDHPPENPRLLLDPGRRHGLETDHPFTKALFKGPIARLRSLLEEDRKKERSRRKEIANDETKKRLDSLAKAASRFLRRQVDELEELGTDEAVDDESLVKTGILIYPTFLNVELERERTLTVYVNKALVESADAPVVVTADNEALQILGSPFALHPHKSHEDRLLGTFRVMGRAVRSDVCITAKCNGLPPVEALAQVIERKVQDRVFDQPLEFEREEYRVRFGSQKTLKLFARMPDVVRSATDVSLASEDGTTVAVRGKCRLSPVIGTNYAVGEVRVHGKRLKAKAGIRASLNGHQALTDIKVIERPDKVRGPKIEIKLCPKEFGSFRAQWANHEGRPNLLLVAGLHPSLIRYVGKPRKDGTFPGQDNPIYRALLAEIVAEAVCRKSLQLETRERPWDFRFADLKEDEKISDDVIARLQQRLREFLPIAHREMVQERDARQQVIIESA